jgi:hypothetical protein
MKPFSRRQIAASAVIVLTASLAATALLHWLQGPILPGYHVLDGPLIQNVVATGRVAAPSRVQIGTEITGLVLERRVIEGDHVHAGDVLLVLRAQDLEARRDQARAALQALRQNERPDAEARLRQARAQLAQAEREHARRQALAERQLVSRESVEQARLAVVAARAAAEQAQLMNALSSQSLSTRMISFFVAMSVALGIASVLAVSVTQRTREIGILRAIGMRRGQMLRVFLVQGAVLGLAGSLLGAIAGLGLVGAFNTFGPGLFFIPLPPLLVPAAMALATVAGVLAAAIPAARAARLDPVEAIRHG